MPAAPPPPPAPAAAPGGTAAEPARPRVGGGARAAIALLMAAYALFAAATWGRAYLDFGDGQYLYVARRVADGLVLYRDVLSPQPPIHTVIGAALLRLGDALGLALPVLAVRTYSLLLHLATAALLAFLARLLAAAGGESRRPRLDAASVATAAAYLTIPLGLWWTLGYQTHPTLMFLFVASMTLLLLDRPWSVVAAGAVMGLTPLTSMTATPYVAFTLLWLLLRHPRRFLRFAPACVGIYAAGAAWFQWRSEGTFLSNVVFNQVGSFPKEEITGEPLWRYAARKISREGAKIIGLEAGYLVASWAGLAWWGVRAWGRRWRYLDYVVLMTLGFWGSLVFVSKGATVDYIFTIGEPMACVFAGLLVGHLVMEARAAAATAHGRRRGVLVAATAALGLALVASATRTAFFARDVLEERMWELDEAGVDRIVEVIERTTQPGDAILAPPFYAFITGRRVAGDYAEIFLWTIKYMNETQLAENRGKPPGEGVLKVRELAGMLERREIPLVILDLNQTGRLPEIRAALAAAYRPLGEQFSTLNTPLRMYIPRGESELASMDRP